MNTSAPSETIDPIGSGSIPEGWRVVPVKRALTFSTGWTPPTGEEHLYVGDIPWANIGDLGSRVLLETQKTISPEAVRTAGMAPSPEGSLLFSFKLSVGAVSLAGREMYTNEAIATFHPSQEISTDFLFWAAPVFIPLNAAENIYGAKLLSRERIANAKIWFPPIPSQRAIAAFLDRKTAEIDALVAKKEELIELLEEKRTALITDAVTKGLEPGVAMKDSGVEWLGEIPAHWTVTRVRDIANSLQTGPFGSQLHAGQYVQDGVPIINPSHIQRGKLVPDSESTIDDATANGLARHKLVAGDIVFARRGELGRCGLVTSEEEGWICGTGSLRLRPRFEAINPEFILYFLSIAAVRKWLELQSVGSTMLNLNTTIIGRLPLAFPNLSEQDKIVGVITDGNERIDQLVTNARTAVDRLKEYRSALITAAVTGQIEIPRQEAV